MCGSSRWRLALAGWVALLGLLGPLPARAGIVGVEIETRVEGLFHLGSGLIPVGFTATSVALRQTTMSALLASPPPLSVFPSVSRTTPLPGTTALTAVRFALGSGVTPAPHLRVDLLLSGITLLQVPVPLAPHSGVHTQFGIGATAIGGAWTTGALVLTTPGGAISTVAGLPLVGPTQVTPSLPTRNATSYPSSARSVQLGLVKPIHLVTSGGLEAVGFLRLHALGTAFAILPEPAAGALLLGALALLIAGRRR